MITCRLLGPITLAVDGGPPPPELLWKKNLALLLYLARSPGRVRSREHLIGLLWGERDPSAARHSLREAIRVLRKGVGESGVETAGDQVRLVGESVVLDVTAFEERISSAAWREAAACVAGEPLEGFGVPDANGFEDWLAAERLYWRRRSAEALYRAAEERLAAGDTETAVTLADRALVVGPSVPVARTAMRAHALRGDPAAALRVYDAWTRGGADAPELAALADRIRSGRQWRIAAKTAPSLPGRRPPLVGDATPLRTLVEQWEEVRATGRVRLGLLYGDPGIGKSRSLEELSARASLDGGTVARARAVHGDREEPYGALMALAREGLLMAPGAAGAAPAAHAALAARIPEWADRFGAAARGVTAAPLGVAFADVVRAVTEQAPLLLLLDDAGHLDDPSVQTLETLFRDLVSAPLLVVLTTSGAGAVAGLDALRVRVGREISGCVLALVPLDLPALEALARWELPRYTAEEVTRVARRVEADTAGIPLLAVELLYAVSAGLALDHEAPAWPVPDRTLDQSLPGDLPDVVVAAVRVGARTLSRDAFTALTAAAVLGERIPVAKLARATGLAPEALGAALDELEWQRWLHAEPRGYTFVARIVREVVARDLLTAGQRQRIVEAAG